MGNWHLDAGAALLSLVGHREPLVAARDEIDVARGAAAYRRHVSEEDVHPVRTVALPVALPVLALW